MSLIQKITSNQKTYPTYLNIGEIAAGGAETPHEEGRIYVAEQGQTQKAPHYIKPEDISSYEGLVSATVRGASMSPAYYDGDTVYFYQGESTDPESLIGKDCVVTIDGRLQHHVEHEAMFLKRLRRGDSGGNTMFGIWKASTAVFLTKLMSTYSKSSPSATSNEECEKRFTFSQKGLESRVKWHS